MKMRFVPYHQLDTSPNIIVDGAAGTGTILTLSHWPKSGTPTNLKRDTSAEIVFAYLDSPSSHVHADIVSNNHFDEDGLVGIFTLVDPVTAEKNRDLLLDAASAGDFGVFKRREAARISFTISAYANPDTPRRFPRDSSRGHIPRWLANFMRSCLRSCQIFSQIPAPIRNIGTRKIENLPRART